MFPTELYFHDNDESKSVLIKTSPSHPTLIF